jgi:hypothetical protein
VENRGSNKGNGEEGWEKAFLIFIAAFFRAKGENTTFACGVLNLPGVLLFRYACCSVVQSPNRKNSRIFRRSYRFFWALAGRLST